ncbi:MAG TPA: hypothetical protein H9881_16250, partial [Candidatus Stackebrandtia excrementipullorum]|nr:hypothetical protein [Candidatus Stackebrandtia excrementipullorum]
CPCYAKAFVSHAVEDGRPSDGDRDFGVAQEEYTVVDASFRMRFTSSGIDAYGVEGVASGQQPAVGGGVDGRRQEGRAVEQQWRHGVAVAEDGDGMGRPEVDAEVWCGGHVHNISTYAKSVVAVRSEQRSSVHVPRASGAAGDGEAAGPSLA